MNTKEQYIKKNIIWNLFFAILYSSFYLFPLLLIFNTNQCIILYIILISINYNNINDIGYIEYCLEFKQDKDAVNN